MELDDGLGLDQALAQSLVLPLQLRYPRGLGIDCVPLTAVLAWRQPRQGPGLALAPPGSQVRGVQALTAQQGADLPVLAAVGLLQHPQLLLGRRPPASGLLDHFGVGGRRRRSPRWGRRLQSPLYLSFCEV